VPRTGANAWSTLVPSKRDYLVPTGSRAPITTAPGPGDNRHANSVVALKARRANWCKFSFHHDLWDYDAAPPVLIEFRATGIAVNTKMGNCSCSIARPETAVPRRSVLPEERRAGRGGAAHAAVSNLGALPQTIAANELTPAGAVRPSLARATKACSRRRASGARRLGNVGGVNWEARV
jgi:hypothetical protein